MALYTILLILFLVLKISGSAAMSWWWVFSPIWLPIISISFLVIFKPFFVDDVIGFILMGMISLILLVLKISGAVSIGLIWVFSPLFIPIILAITGVVSFYMLALCRWDIL